MKKHIYYTQEIKLSEDKELSITYNFDNGLTDPMEIDDQYSIEELEKINKEITKFIKVLKREKALIDKYLIK
jgi:hypothetical protein